MKSHGKVKMYLTAIMSYVLVLIIPMIITTSLYISAERRILKQQQKISQTNLEKIESQIESQLLEIQNIVLQIARDSRTQAALSLKGELNRDDYFILYEFSKLMSSVPVGTESCIKDIYVQFLNIDRIHTVTSPYSLKSFYGQATQKEISETSEYYSILTQKKYYNEYKYLTIPKVASKPSREVCVLYSLPINSSNPSAVISVIVDMSETVNQAKAVLSTSQDCVMIMDGQSNKIVQVGTEMSTEFSYEDVNNANGILGNYYIENVDSKITDWIYVWLTPNNYVVSAVSELRLYLVISFIVILLVESALVFFFSRKNTDPLIYLTGVLDMDIASIQLSRLGDSIARKVEALIKRNHEMQIRIENIETENRKQIDLWNNDSETMMNALLLRLLQGRYGDVDRTLIALGRLGVYFPYQFFIIAIIDTTCQRLCDSLTQIDDLTFESVADDRGRNVIIINMTFEQINTAHKKMEEFAINGDIERLVLGISELHEDIDKISEAYKEAMKASEYCYLYNRHISYYGSIIESQENYQYTIEDEWRIINAIIKGNSSDALKILNEIIETNMNKKVLSINMLRSLILDIDTTLVRACTIGNLSERIDPFENISKQQHLSDYQEYVSQLIDKMCKEAVKNKEDEDELYEEIKQKVMENIRNPQLSVQYIAELVNKSGSYISHYFKEHGGITLIDYIAQKKVEDSIKMIREDKPISEIAHEYGYADASSYSRAFKKYMLVSPGAYRKSATINDLQGR